MRRRMRFRLGTAYKWMLAVWRRGLVGENLDSLGSLRFDSGGTAIV